MVPTSSDPLPRCRPTMAEPIVDRIVRRLDWLDRLGDEAQRALGGLVARLGRPGRVVKDLLHGTWLGHPLHPVLTDVVVGAWTVAIVADYAAHFTDRVPTEAGDVALAVGLVTALATTASGIADALSTYGMERRVATLHALVVDTAVTADAASLFLRWFGGAGLHPVAVALATLGYAVVTVGGYLGGHLSFGYGTGVNRTAFLSGPEDFVPIGSSDDFPEGEMRVADAAGVPVLVVRLHGQLLAIADTCSHAGGPLHEGSLEDTVVVCPWHGSRFCLVDGRVRGGPATFPQPRYIVHEEGGTVTVRAERSPA